jgi:hypothetical protein
MAASAKVSFSDAAELHALYVNALILVPLCIVTGVQFLWLTALHLSVSVALCNVCSCNVFSCNVFETAQ